MATQTGTAGGLRETATPRRGWSTARREAFWGYVFISPWLAGFLIFTLLPMLATIAFSLTNMRLEFSETQFVGMQNYRSLLADRQAWQSMQWTLVYGAIALPVSILLPLGIALLMNHRALTGKTAFRAGFYFPYIIPFVAAIFIWAQMLNPEGGWINKFLEWAGVGNPPAWLRDPLWVYPSLILIGLWGIGNAMLLNLAALQGVPTELYDAAEIDGAGSWSSFWNVTFPMISPVIFYNLILTVVGLFQYFQVPLVVNQGTGAPGGMTLFYNLYLYKTFFAYQNMSYGATLAWVLFLVILVVTMVLFWSQRFWVYYAGGDRR